MTGLLWDMSVLDPRLVEQIAEELLTEPGLIEKYWYLVRAIGAMAEMDHGGAAPAFSGGTALSKGWGLIERFSEDIDFKVVTDTPPTAEQLEDLKFAWRCVKHV